METTNEPQNTSDPLTPAEKALRDVAEGNTPEPPTPVVRTSKHADGKTHPHGVRRSKRLRRKRAKATRKRNR